MARILVFNGTDPATDPQPYGADALTALGHTLVAAPRTRLPRKVRDVVHHRYGVQIDRPGLREAARSDLVLAYLEPNIAWPAAARRLPLSPYRRTPLVSVVCWAAEDLERADDLQRRRVLRMLGASDLVGYFSANQTGTYRAHGIAEERLVVLPFGVDVPDSPGAPGATRDIDVVAVGWDRGRDYATLAAAVRGTDLGVDVVARPDNLAGLDLPPGLRALGTVAREDYFALLRRARVVVVPTLELAYPTGQSVALEAATSGAAVVVTDTPAMRDYFTPDVTALMPPPGDPDTLRAALQVLLTDEDRRTALAAAGRAHALAHHRSARTWQVLDSALRERGLLDTGSRRSTRWSPH